MTNITLSTEEAISLQRQHVKHELMDYRHYRSRAAYLTEKIERLDYKLDGNLSAAAICASGGSMVKASDSWITAAMAEQEELLRERGMVMYHTGLVELWMSQLAQSNIRQYDAVRVYVILNNCTRLEESAKLLGYKTKRELLRDIEDSITKILEKN